MRRFRILIVDDEPSTLDQAVKLMYESIPRVSIDRAESISEARARIEGADQISRHYDLAILDFKLPKQTGGAPDVDESLCREIGLRMPRAVVAHITGFSEDERIVEHLNRLHKGRIYGFYLDKRDNDFGLKLTEESRQCLVNKDIESRVQLLDVKSHGAEGEGAPRNSQGSATNIVMDLMMDIRATWVDLWQPNKQLVRSKFDVDDGTLPIGITLR